MQKYLSVILLLCLFSCGSDETSQKRIAELTEADRPDQISKNVKVLFTDSSIVKAILTADEAKIYYDRKKTRLNGHVYVEFLSKYTQKRMSYLKADTAEIDDRTKDMHAWGNILVYSDSSQTRLETSVLKWNNTTQLFFSDAYVKIIKVRDSIQGYGFESDQNLTKYKIYKVSGERK